MSLAVIILTYNESLHLARCLESIRQVASEIHIVDCFSTDDTVAIGERYGAKVHQRKWKSYADQFQWGMDHCGINTPWVMRMDADEYLEPALVQEINQQLHTFPESVTGLYIRRKVLFKEKWIRYGGFYPHTLLRIWRNGKANVEQRWMDEHIVVSSGETRMLKEHLVDHNLNSIHWWVNKHNNYAIREMIDLLNIKYRFMELDQRLLGSTNVQARRKRLLKEKVYSAIPPGGRALLYFCYRYFLRFGFLDGYRGFVFHFMQGYWYRLLVDVNVKEFEAKLAGDTSAAKLKEILKNDYNIAI
ncbi:glycosyltransferase family 2 protein [Chitinophaga pollutisoli]|uniref:Glycosyltransferase family 2 protein n=1 Tax=Chitinophaga pollutisoli TaxID=3133966 RepID=A0ABZ2YFZ7_9BACT